MKRLLALALLVCTVFTLTACSFTCDMCTKEVDGKKYKHKIIDNIKVTVCEDCHDDFEEMKEFYAALYED